MYQSLLASEHNVFFYSLGNDLFHKIFGKDKAIRDLYDFSLYKRFSFYYFPGLLPEQQIDRIFTKMWAKSYIKSLNLSCDGGGHSIIAEAGVSSVIVHELLRSFTNLKIHYRINDPIDGFRAPSAHVSHCHEQLLSLKDPRLVLSAPVPDLSENVLHIPPGIDFIRKTEGAKTANILYWGVYPIARWHLRSILRAYPQHQLKYTGARDLNVPQAEFLGLMPPEELAEHISDAAIGVMIFPDTRFDWWMWSNKMMLMQSLELPIIGMLFDSDRNIIDEYRDLSAEFYQCGLVPFGVSEVDVEYKTSHFYDWDVFSAKIIGGTSV